LTIRHLIIALGDLHRRLLPVVYAAIGPRGAYAISGALGRLFYWLLPAPRMLTEVPCRAALAGRVPDASIPGIAAESWLHRVWSLTDLLLAERLLHPGTYQRYGGKIPDPHRANMLDAQRRRQPVILLSAYYGSFDLLPVFLGFNGVRAAAVYLTHENRAFDALRRRVRARSGTVLVPVEAALHRLPQVLSEGGTIALIADHHAQKRGIPITFLGLPTSALRSVGLLAWRYDAEVVVAGIRRLRRRFEFAIEVMDVIKPSAWRDAADPVVYITERYTRALEQLVLRDPAQYLWLNPRWSAAPMTVKE
jgi:Kdo2-lipid IVA lauroyltransferase/acyltransferase